MTRGTTQIVRHQSAVPAQGLQ